jgi:hypothetical protein
MELPPPPAAALQEPRTPAGLSPRAIVWAFLDLSSPSISKPPVRRSNEEVAAPPPQESDSAGWRLKAPRANGFLIEGNAKLWQVPRVLFGFCERGLPATSTVGGLDHGKHGAWNPSNQSRADRSPRATVPSLCSRATSAVMEPFGRRVHRRRLAPRLAHRATIPSTSPEFA